MGRYTGPVERLSRREGVDLCLAAELRAAELCLALPVEPDEQLRLERQLAVVRARLN